MAEEIRVTQSLNGERHTFGVEGQVNGEYFQFGYFQASYFQVGAMQVSSNTDSSTVSLDNDRMTVRLD